MILDEVKQLVDRLKQEFDKDGYLSDDATAALSHTYENYEKKLNSQQQAQSHQEMIKLVSILFPLYLHILSGEPQFVQNKQQKTRNAILDLLAKQIKSTEHNAQIFQKIMSILEKDNELNAKIGAKILNELIKQSNQSNQQRSGANRNQEQNGQNSIQKHILTLYKFLERKTQFLKDIQKYIDMRNDSIQIYMRKEEVRSDRNNQTQQPEKILQNEDSINFLTQIPHIYVYTMAYIETQNQEVHFQIKESIKNSIENIVQALSKTPFEEIYTKLTRQFNMDLFSVMHKMTQFLYILMRKDKDIQQDHVNSQNLLRHAREQVEHIQFEQIIKATLNLLKNCPEDFHYHRIEIVNRLKYLINCMLPTSKLQDVSEIINENVILGKNKFISDYTKNALYNFWIDIIRTLFVDKFHEHNQKGDYAQDNEETFRYIYKIFDSLIKNIFDNSLYLQVHEKSLELIKKLIDTLYLSNRKDNYKILQKKNLLYKVLHAISLKFGEICENFSQIKAFIKQNKTESENTKTNQKKPEQSQQHQQQQQKEQMDIEQQENLDNFINKLEKQDEDLLQQSKQHLHLNQMPKRETEDDKQWNIKRLKYIEQEEINIEQHLLTLSASTSCHLNIYDEEDELIINGTYIRENSFIDHMKDIKNKIVDLLIEITKKILTIFYSFQYYNLTLGNNITEEYLENVRNQQQPFVTSFQIVRGSKVYGQLNSEACVILGKILKNGLQVFEFFHDFKIHNDERERPKTNQTQVQKVNLSTFMSIFATVFYEINFKNIVEPNMELIFKYLLKYARDCSDQCLQNLIIEPFCNLESQASESGRAHHYPDQAQMPKWNKNIVEILTHYLLLRLEESMEPFHPFYEYRDDYFCLLQKLIRFPFRCLSKFGDDSFLKQYFRQIVLFLIKKAHTSEYSLEYLQLLRTLFKNLIFNQNTPKSVESQLFTDFNSICYKPSPMQDPRLQSQNDKTSIFSNVNITENLMAFYDTGIPELKEIVTELMMMLPLKSKFLIQLAKSKIIAKPLINSLLLTDGGLAMRTLKTLEIIIQNLSFDEVNYFLDDVKEDLLVKLYKILRDAKPSDINQSKSNDNGSVGFAFKLLGKLGHIPRMQKNKIDVDMKKTFQEEELNLILKVYQQNKSERTLSLNFLEAIHYSMDILKKLLENNFALYVLKGSTLETSFCLVKIFLLRYFDFRENEFSVQEMQDKDQKIKIATFKQLHSKLFKKNYKDQAKVIFSHQFQEEDGLMERVLCIFMELVSLNFKLNITQSLIQRIKEQSELFLKNVGQVIGYAYADEMKYIMDQQQQQQQNQQQQQILKVDYQSDSQKNAFIKCILKSLKQKVIIIREDLLQQKDLIMQPGQFLWDNLKNIIKTVKDQLDYFKTQNENYDCEEQYHEFCSFLLQNFVQEICKAPAVLIHRHCLIVCLLELLDLIPDKTFLQNITQFLQIIFAVMIDLPEVIVVGTNKQVLSLKDKVFEKMEALADQIPEETHRKLLEIFVSNLVVYKENTHSLAKDCIQRLSKVRSLDILSMLYQSYTNPSQDIKFGASYFQKLKSGSKFIEESLEETPNPSPEDLLPLHFTIKQLFSDHNTLYISQILKHIFVPLETRAEHHNEKKLALLSTVYKTLDFLLNCTACPAFRVLIFNESQKQIDEQEQQKQQQQPSQQQQNPQQNAYFKEKYFNIDGQMHKSFIKQGLSIIDLNERHFKNTSKVIQQTPQNQQRLDQNSQGGQAFAYQINNRLSFNDEEYNLNIEDIDLNTKAWSNLLSSIMVFLKSVLLLPSVYQVCKKNSKNRDKSNQESCEILRNRFVIIFKLFEMIMRVERTVRNTASKCLKELLKHEQHPKDLLSNDDKLKVILRPVLICLQREFKYFTPAFLLVLRKILKLLTQCFNKALSDKLLSHLQEINPFITQIITQFPQDTTLLQNNCKCINGLLGLFEHLSYAYQIAMPQYPKDSLSKIIKNVLQIEANLGKKIGKFAIQQLTRKPLIRFINTMASSAIEFFFGDPETAKLLLDLLKLDSAHILRERLSRDKQLFINRLNRCEDMMRNKQNLNPMQQEQLKQNDPILMLRIIKTMSAKNPRSLRNNRELLDKLNKKLQDIVNLNEQQQNSNNGNTLPASSSIGEYQRKSETSLIIKILLNYCRENRDDVETLFSLVEVAKIRLPRDQSFLRNFFKNEIFKLYSTEEKRRIFLYFLQYMDKKDVKVESKINASFLVIYPLLVKCQKAGELKQVISREEINTFTDFIKGLHSNNKQHQHNRLDIEILQLSSLLMTFKKDEFSEHKKALLSFGWHFLKIFDDKILKHFAYIFTCKFIKIFGIPEEMVLQIYVALLKGQDDMASHDYEISALSKKALNILIPYLAKKNWKNSQQQQQQQSSQVSSSTSLQQQKSQTQIEQTGPNSSQQSQQQQQQGQKPQEREPQWIRWTLKIFSEDNYIFDNTMALLRFWQIFIKNHAVYFEYKKHFMTQMINSMQYIMMGHNNNNQNQLHKKIAWDLSFLYIEWKFKELKEHLQKVKQLAKQKQAEDNVKQIEVEKGKLNETQELLNQLQRQLEELKQQQAKMEENRDNLVLKIQEQKENGVIEEEIENPIQPAQDVIVEEQQQQNENQNQVEEQQEVKSQQQQQQEPQQEQIEQEEKMEIEGEEEQQQQQQENQQEPVQQQSEEEKEKETSQVVEQQQQQQQEQEQEQEKEKEDKIEIEEENNTNEEKPQDEQQQQQKQDEIIEEKQEEEVQQQETQQQQTQEQPEQKNEPESELQTETQNPETQEEQQQQQQVKQENENQKENTEPIDIETIPQQQEKQQQPEEKQEEQEQIQQEQEPEIKEEEEQPQPQPEPEPQQPSQQQQKQNLEQELQSLEEKIQNLINSQEKLSREIESQTIELDQQKTSLSNLEEKLETKEENIEPTKKQIESTKQFILDHTYKAEESQQQPEILISFFTKVAIHSCQEKDDKEFMQRCLYLLKKTLFIWPHTKIKYDNFKNQMTKFQNQQDNPQNQPQQQQNQNIDKLKFQYSFLNILNILLEFDKPDNIFQNLSVIIELISPSTSNLNLVQVDNPYLIHLICCIMKRLLKVAYARKEEEEGTNFLRKVNKMVQDGIDHYVKHYCYSQNHPPRERGPPNRTNPINIYLCIRYAKLLFEFDDRQIEHSLNPIKQIMSIFVELFKRQKDRGDSQLQNYQNKKYIEEETSLSCMFHLLPLQGSEDYKNTSQQEDDILENTQVLYDDEFYEVQKLKYQNFRDFLIVLLRIIGAKFNAFTHKEDSGNILKTYMYILDNLQDYDLKYEVTNLLKCLFLGNAGFKDGILPKKYSKMQIANMNGDKKMEYFFDFEQISKIFDKKVIGSESSQQNYIIGSKIAEERVLRSYLQFLCQLAQENHYNWQTQEKLRQFLFLISKVSSGKDLKFLFSQISQIYGGNPLYIMFLILGETHKTKTQPPSENQQQQQQQRQQQQKLLPEGEEVLLFAFKYIIFYYMEQSKYEIEIKNIDSSSPIQVSLVTQKNKKKPSSAQNPIIIPEEQQQNGEDQEQQEKEHQKSPEKEIKIEENEENNMEIEGNEQKQQQQQQSEQDQEVKIEEKEEELEEMEEEEEPEDENTQKKNQAVFDYLNMYKPNILQKDNYIELIFDLLTNEHPGAYSLCSTLLKPLFITLFNFFKKSLSLNQRRQVITAIENYLIQNEVAYFWANTLSEILAEEIQEDEGLLIQPEKMFVISKKLICWANGQYYLESLINNEQTNSSGAIFGLLELYNSLGDSDYSYGLKSLLTDDQKIKKALLMCQQREWKRCYNYFEKIKFEQYNFDNDQSEEEVLENMLDQSFQSGMIQDIYKNLNKWDDLKQIAEDTHNLALRMETSMACKDMAALHKIKDEMAKDKYSLYIVDNVSKFHCQALMNFNDSINKAQHVAPQNIQQNLNQSIYFAFRDWLKLPKVLTSAHTNILNKIQVIIELEEGFKLREIKDFSTMNSQQYQQQQQQQQQQSQDKNLENFDHFYQYIGLLSQGLNQWRERMPHKYEDIVVWKNIIDQRVFIQSAINLKMKEQLEIYLNSDNSNPQYNNNNMQGNMEIERPNGSQQRDAGKYLKPFMDITWSNLKFERQMLNFNIILDNKYESTEDYHPEEKYMFAKYKGKVCSNDKFSETLLTLKETISDFGKPYLKDDFKDYRSELMRMQGLLNLNNNNMQDAFQDLSDSIRQCGNHYKTWKTWLDISFNSFIKNNHEVHYGKIPFYCINHAMRYKPYKSRLYFSDILFILQTANAEQRGEYEEVLKTVIQEIPVGTVLLWVPQFCSMVMKGKFKPQFQELLQRITCNYMQHMFYQLSCYHSNAVETVYKKIHHDLNNMHLFAKMEKVWSIIDKKQLGKIERYFNDFSQIFENIYKIQNVQQLKDWLPKIKERLQAALKIDELQEFLGDEFMNEMQLCQHDTLSFLHFIRKNVYNKLLEIITHKIQAKKDNYINFSSEEFLLIQQNLGEIEIPGQYIWEQKGVTFREFYNPREKNNILISSVSKHIGVAFKNRKLIRQLTLIGNNQKSYLYNMEQVKNYVQPPPNSPQTSKNFTDAMVTNSYLHLYSQLTAQFQELLNVHFQISRETCVRHLRLQNPQQFNLCPQTYISPSKKTFMTFSNILDSYLAEQNYGEKDQNHGYHYPLSLMKEEVLEQGWHIQSKAINTQMKNLVPEDLLKNFILKHCTSIQDFLSIRKEMTYNMSSSQFMTYLVNHEGKLDDYNIDFNEGQLFIKDISLKNMHNSQVSPYCIRLSRNFVNFIGDIGVTGIMGNSFVAMANSISKQSTMFKTYIYLIMKEFQHSQQKDSELSQKMEEVSQKIHKLIYEDYQNNNKINVSNEPYHTRVFSILDSYQDIGEQNHVPSQLKYWF